MKREEIKNKLVEIIVDLHPRLEKVGIKEESNFFFDLDMDSLDLVDRCMEVEKEFHIEITDAEAEKLTTFGQLLDLVEQKVNN